MFIFAQGGGVEFEAFAVGKWNGMEFSRVDLEQIARNFDALVEFHKVPLKLGHNEEQPMTDGQPALGWVSKVWVGDNDKLMMRAEYVPDRVKKAMEKKLYRKVSIELDLGVEHKGKKYQYVLSGVALLGADLPAVNTLADLDHYIDGEPRLAASRRSVFSAIQGQVKFNKEDDMSITIDDVKNVVKEAMSPFAQGIESRDKQIAEFTKREKDREDADKATKVKANRDNATVMLEDAVKTGTITPAQREAFGRAIGMSDDDRMVSFDAEALKGMIGVTKNSQDFATDTGKHKATYQRQHDNADKELVRLIEQEMAETKSDYQTAHRSIFNRHPELAKEWLNGSNSN